MARYALLDVLITIPGMILGWATARCLIAEFLYRAEITYYTIDNTSVTPLTPRLFISAPCVVTVTCGNAALSCRRLLKLTPAALARPKPPAHGHRILLERITPFWRSLSFSGKIVTRSLFRNKARVLMGLVGIIDSTSLILCDLELMNSINAMLDRAFDETVMYSVEIKSRTPSTSEQLSDVYDTLSSARNINTTMVFSVSLYGEGGNVQGPYLVVMDEEQKSLSFRNMEGNSIRLPQDGALIIPRMAEVLNVNVSDTLTAERLDGVVIPLKITQIVDFPIGNEVYISKITFLKVSDLPLLIRTLLINGQGLDLDKLESDPKISLIETKEEMRNDMLIVLEALQGFQIILIVFSGLLAFAAMMVLGRMNYCERIRELATLKILGFYRTGMGRLILRESIWITISDLPFGFAISSLLLRIILSQATTPDLEIAPIIPVLSIATSFAFIFGFTILMNHVIGRKFKNTDMVISLKSVE